MSIFYNRILESLVPLKEKNIVLDSSDESNTLQPGDRLSIGNDLDSQNIRNFSYLKLLFVNSDRIRTQVQWEFRISGHFDYRTYRNQHLPTEAKFDNYFCSVSPIHGEQLRTIRIENVSDEPVTIERYILMGVR